jgi:cytochrome P450
MVIAQKTGGGTLPLDDIDLYSASAYAEGSPHEAWRRLRDEDPVRRELAPGGIPYWSVTRYADVVAILRDTARFSSEHSTMLTVLERDTAAGQAIHLTDPPRHATVRAATVRSMSMRVMQTHEACIRDRIRRLVARAVAGREIDLARLLTVLPMLVAGELMGIPREQWAPAARWTVASMAPEDPSYAMPGTTPQATLKAAHVFLFGMFLDLVAERRRHPGDDLVSQLCRMQIDGRPATDEEVLVNCYAFIMGANPTIPQASAHFVLAMAQRPEVWQRVRAERELLPSVLEETLRWSSPVNHLLRRTTTEVELRGHTLPAGSLVAAWIGSANFDERVFRDPHTFDPDRRPNPHITFGYGAHRCVGNAAAQTGVRLLIDELAEQVATIEQAGPVRHLRSNFLNGITSLPVVLTPGERP